MKFKNKKLFLLLLLFLLILLSILIIFTNNSNNEPDKPPIIIAMVGPKDSKTRKSMNKGIELCFDEINNKGGIDNRKLVLEVYDDKDDTKTAYAKAEEISKSKAVAVIGHWKTSCTRKASLVYSKNEIPFISPGSTGIIPKSDWFFRTVFSDYEQGIYISNYAIKALGHCYIYIISEAKYLDIILKAFAFKYEDVRIDDLERSISSINEVDNIVKELKNKTSILKFDKESFKFIKKQMEKRKIPKDKIEQLIEKVKTIEDTSFNNKYDLLEKLNELLDEFNGNLGEEELDNYKSILLKCAGYNSLIFLSTYTTIGAELLKKIQEFGITNPIIVTDSFDSNSFRKKLKELDVNNLKNEMYIATHLIFDSANERAQEFKTKYIKYSKPSDIDYPHSISSDIDYPDWISAISYDTAKVLVKAIEDSNTQVINKKNIIDWEELSIQYRRRLIKENLTKINNANSAVEGLTGKIYFNERGEAQNKPIKIGMLRKNKVISAFTQLEFLSPYSHPSNDTETDQIIYIHNKPMYITNVVYTGIELNDIKGFSPKKETVYMDFYLWFRYRGQIDPEVLKDISFLNGVHSTPSSISITTLDGNNIYSNGVSIKAIDEKKDDDISIEKTYYKLYHIQGRFKAFYQLKNALFDQYSLGFKFRHNQLPSHKITYVVDYFGMGLDEEEHEFFNIQENRTKRKSLYGWKIVKSSFSQEATKLNSLGGMKYTEPSNFSTYKFSYEIKKDSFLKIRRAFSETSCPFIFFSALIILLLLCYYHIKLKKKYNNLVEVIKEKIDPDNKQDFTDEERKFNSDDVKKKLTKSNCLLFVMFLVLALEFFSIVVFLLALEKMLIYYFSNLTSQYQLSLLICIFDILLWFLSFLFIQLISTEYVLEYIKMNKIRTKEMTSIVKKLITILIYGIMLCCIVKYVFHYNIASALTFGSVFIMIVGIAIETNISDYISGLFLPFTGHFSLKDSVKIGELEGVIEQINLRSTRIVTSNNCVVSIPNSTVMSSFVHNFSKENNKPINSLIKINISIDPKYDYEDIKKILKSALGQVEKVKQDTININVNKVSLSSIDYILLFSINEYNEKDEVIPKVWEKIWHKLKQNKVV